VNEDAQNDAQKGEDIPVEDTSPESQKANAELAAAVEAAVGNDTDELEAQIAGADVVDGEALGEHNGGTPSFTGLTIAGEEVQIVGKAYYGQTLVLITDEGAQFVAPTDASMDLEPYDPKKHGGEGVEKTDEPQGGDEDEGGAQEEPIG
jgi:hypothetical protein